MKFQHDKGTNDFKIRFLVTVSIRYKAGIWIFCASPIMTSTMYVFALVMLFCILRQRESFDIACFNS